MSTVILLDGKNFVEWVSRPWRNFLDGCFGSECDRVVLALLPYLMLQTPASYIEHAGGSPGGILVRAALVQQWKPYSSTESPSASIRSTR